MKNKLILLFRLVAAAILLQTLFFKFTAAPESVFIFETLGVEPWGRILSGVFELIAGIALLVPRTQILGALMGVGVMFGAIASHLLFLGIEVQSDGGLLFALACTVTIACILTLGLQCERAKAEALGLIAKFRK
ncbi:MAG: DoxX family protein [Bdellovibrionales bacterium]|nr:DoxX family protein [Bdellovibrionales bacterium]